MQTDSVAIIIARPNDIHALSVAGEIYSTFNKQAVILNTEDYPNIWRLSMTVSSGSGSRWIIRGNDWEIHSEEVAGVWWRRPYRHRVAPEVKGRRVRFFCEDEAQSAFSGWIHSLGRRVINPLFADRRANRKPFQLLKAGERGLKIPDTVITNDPEEARSFLDKHNGSAVFKILTGTSWQFTETRLFKDEYYKQLENLRYAPAIFQELIEAQCDIRATVVDDRVFTASIKPIHPDARLDWRMDLASEIEPHDLPQETERTLIDFMGALGLRFGAIDLRLTPDNEYVFLEVNPGGQFLFCEIHAGHPISRALAAALLQLSP